MAAMKKSMPPTTPAVMARVLLILFLSPINGLKQMMSWIHYSGASETFRLNAMLLKCDICQFERKLSRKSLPPNTG